MFLPVQNLKTSLLISLKICFNVFHITLASAQMEVNQRYGGQIMPDSFYVFVLWQSGMSFICKKEKLSEDRNYDLNASKFVI